MTKDRRFIFILGGARSGKSSYALRLADTMPGPKVYLATAEALDPEMHERIKKHRQARSSNWETLEETIKAAARVEDMKEGVVLLDCVTLLLTNLIAAGLDDGALAREVERLVSACRSSKASVIAVSNEVGLGIVPENALARRFRDIAGAANQRLAEKADEVVFVASGLPFRLK